MFRILLPIILVICLLSLFFIQEKDRFINSVDIEFVLVPAGSFKMGESRDYLEAEKSGTPAYLKTGDYDEHPVHKVEISESFFLSVTEVTVEQFREFRPEYKGVEKYYPYATGISWYEAAEYCKWLSEKEGRPYRLPTEAEWEYAARTGDNLKSDKDIIDSVTIESQVNKWQIKNLNNSIAEWVYDWYGEYKKDDQVDPAGPSTGYAKVVRGAGLDSRSPFYSRFTNRAGIAPDFPPVPLEEIHKVIADADSIEANEKFDNNKPEGFSSVMLYQNFIRDESNNHGNHNIGFRIVQAPMPSTKPYLRKNTFFSEGVKQSTEKVAHIGTDETKPFFRKRYLLPTPPENITPEDNGKYDDLQANIIAGFDPGILSHHHSPALEISPNGDVIAIYYTSVSEVTPDVALIATRLRFGADEWDFPSLFLDFADVDDHAPMLWMDGDTLRFFWGANKLDSGFPFQYINSNDNGALWSKVHFPFFETLIGGHSAQPINSAFRDSEGSIYVASDGIGPESILWKSTNNGKSWIDSGGRTGGRHTTFAILGNDIILGMGGKSSDINGYMPKFISTDKGKTWKIEPTPFTSLGSNQRPTLIRLKSGRLFFAGDFQRIDGYQPTTVNQRGSFVALSEDEGKTWHIKKLIGIQEHESESRRKLMKGATIGYSVARQAPNGNIHLITSMNEPNLHFEMNEAWILSESENNENTESDNLMEQNFKSVNNVKEYSENYPGGIRKIVWHAGISETGQYILHGKETWFFENGLIQYEAEYNKGRKSGEEIFFDRDGNKEWMKLYNDDGTMIWTTFYSNGKKRTESHWKNMHANGMAGFWNEKGELIAEINFVNGKPERKKSLN